MTMDNSAFEELSKRLGNYKLDDALLFLNFVLQASCDPSLDAPIFEFAQRYQDAITHFKIEFLAKWLIIESSNLSPYQLDWPNYLTLSQIYNRIEDPIINDPTFRTRNPIDLFVRMMHQQLPGQQRIRLQSFGSALMLFVDAGAKMADQISYNVPARFREITGLTIEEFMQLGIVVSGARGGPTETRGTFTMEYLRKAFNQGISVTEGAKITQFLQRVSADYQQFRLLASSDEYQVRDPAYILYEFNPVQKRPLIEVQPGCYVAPNPDLIIDRVALGIYYDLFDADGLAFADKMGVVFEEYIGELLAAVYAQNELFREREYGPKHSRKKGPADWTIVEDDVAILMECKTIRPNLELVSIAGRDDVGEYARRIADAIHQLYRHSQAIGRREPGLEEFYRLDFRYLVLTLGRVQAVNTVFFRRLIDDQLTNAGVPALPYHVLSAQELEHLLSLVVKGARLSDLLTRLAEEGAIKALKPYEEELRKDALLSITKQRARSVTEAIIPHRPYPAQMSNSGDP
jgi:hypothetical protein